MRSRDKQKAIKLIESTLLNASDEKMKSILCAAIGHSPVVHSCFGQLTCSRCGDVVGETLLSPYAAEGRAIIGHDCSACREVVKNLTPNDKFLAEPWSPR